MPAPISPRAEAFSSRIERMPFCANPTATARPPMPPPAIKTGCVPAPAISSPSARFAQMFERIFSAQRHARGLVVEVDELFEQRQQRLAVGGLERLQNPRLHAIDRRHDVAQ